jgi:hypothetical protein
MNIKQKVNIHNRFDIEVRDVKTNELKQEAKAYNIILDQMYTRLCNGDSYFNYIHFGSGNTTPVASNTSLNTHLGTKSAVDEEIIKAIPSSSWKRKIVLNPEEYVGDTIAELGIAYGSSASNLVTHALLEDSEGNPISITKTDTDVVTIYATVFVTFDDSNDDLTYINMPSNNDLVNYLVGGSSFSSGKRFELLPGEGYGVLLGYTSDVSWSANLADKKMESDTPRFGIDDGNGHCVCIKLENIFRLNLPSTGIFAGQDYSGVSVGTGDGVETEFILPSDNIDLDSLDIKLDGTLTTDLTSEKISSKHNFNLDNPSILPSGVGRGCALLSDGSILAVAHGTSPYITTYDWDGTAWVKRDNPSTLPSGTGRGCALSSGGTVLAVASEYSPYITTYDWNGSAWVKRDNPSTLPSGVGRGCALLSDGSILAVTHDNSPYITTYDLKKRQTKITFDTAPANGVAITADYTVDGIHKTDQYVIDVSCAIQFGEGV